MNIGFVLSGGAAHGIAHIGILKALSEMGIKPSIISGVSAGAIIGAYYAAGFKEEEILQLAKATSLFSFSDFNFLRGGVFKRSNLQKTLEEHFKDMTFENLHIPLVVNATDFVNVHTIYFNKGELVPILLATSAVPVMYPPVEINGLTLVDGGLLNNFPVEPLSGNCDVIIGCHVNPIDKNVQKLSISNIIARSFLIAVSNTVIHKKRDCALFIEPPEISKLGMFDMSNTDALFKIGYSYTMSMKNEIERIFKK